MKIVSVTFASRYNRPSSTSKQYFFRCYDDVAIGDLVVVDASCGYSVATVEAFIDEIPEDVAVIYPTPDDLSEVVCKVDVAAYEARKDREKRKRELERQIEAQVEALQKEALYKMLAESSPEFRKLLVQYNSL